MHSPVGMEDVEVGVVAQESQVGNNPMKSFSYTWSTPSWINGVKWIS